MENLNTKDRVIRTTTGSVLLLGMLVMSVEPLTITALSLAAFYPLLTALLAWDPFYHVILSISEGFTKTTSSETVSAIAKTDL